MHLGLYSIYAFRFLLSCLLITQLPRNLLIPRIRSIVSCSCLALLRSQLESVSTTMVPILSQHFFILCENLASQILAGGDVKI